MTAIIIAMIFGSIAMVMWQGALDVQSGRLSGGTIAAFVLYGALLAGASGALSEVYGDFLRAAGDLRRRGTAAPSAGYAERQHRPSTLLQHLDDADVRETARGADLTTAARELVEGDHFTANPDIAVITNVGAEHLEQHVTGQRCRRRPLGAEPAEDPERGRQHEQERRFVPRRSAQPGRRASANASTWNGTGYGCSRA